MKYRRGKVMSLKQCGGCVEVMVLGESPGAFIIDNACFGLIAANEGADWIGRVVEYEDAHMRFLDAAEDRAEATRTSGTPRCVERGS